MPATSKNTPLLQILTDTFGFSEFREGQEQTICNLLEGLSTLSVFPTGAGKSLCYQLPAVVLEKQTSIVVSPLLSLIRDQLQQLEKLGIPAGTLNSAQTSEENTAAKEALEAGKFRLFFISPESLLKKEYQSILKNLDLGIVAVDEAHCVSEWGNSFRPSYLLMASAIRKLKPLAILALTATATKEVARDIRSRFKIKTKDHIQSALFRENLIYNVIPCQNEQRPGELSKILKDPKHLPAIVYVMKQIDAESVCAQLQSDGIKARSYHAGMNPDARKAVQDAFIEGKLNIVVATIAFGMGVNKANIRAVVHYHLPKSPEGWIQESGRAGRDGLESHCILLGCADDLIPLTNFILGAQISKNAITRVVEGIFSQGKDITISKYALCQLNDVNESQLDIILCFLISNSFIVPHEPSWRYYQVSRLRYTTHDYGRSKQSSVNAINDHWGKIDTLNAEQSFSISRSRLVNLIDEMEAVGDVAVKKSGLLHHFQLKSLPSDLDATVETIMKSFLSYQDGAVKRIDAVISAATTRSCIPARLIKYFGESIEENCGKCSSCKGEKRSRKLPSSSIPSVSAEQLSLIKKNYSSHRSVLSTPSRLARFCCGISSPAIRHARLYREDEFGFLAKIPYADVISHCRAVIGG